jgi:ribonuclease HI
METILIYTDGGSRGNPGISGAGVFICDIDGEPLKEVSCFLGIKTNNFAEYSAILIGLTTLTELYGEKTKKMAFEFRMDSELIQRQLTGVYKVKHPDMKIFFGKIQALRTTHFPHIEFVHVRREKNKDADRLANEAMDAQK